MNRVFPLPRHDTAAPFALRCAPPWLTVRFRSPQRAVSWSLNRPGLVDTTSVAWLQVRDSDLPADRAPTEWFAELLAAVGLADAVGMMTARSIASFVHRAVTVEEVEAHWDLAEWCKAN